MFENFVVKTDVFSIFAAKIHIQDAKMMNHYGAVLSALPENSVAIDLFRIFVRDTEYGFVCNFSDKNRSQNLCMYESFLNTHTFASRVKITKAIRKTTSCISLFPIYKMIFHVFRRYKAYTPVAYGTNRQCVCMFPGIFISINRMDKLKNTL